MLVDQDQMKARVLFISIFIVVLVLLGAVVSPVDPLSGKPMLYTPGRLQEKLLQAKYEKWLFQISELDLAIDNIISSTSVDFMEASLILDGLLTEVAKLESEIKYAQNQFPTLRQLLIVSSVVENYRSCIQSLYQYYMADDADFLLEATQSFELTRNRLDQLEDY